MYALVQSTEPVHNKRRRYNETSRTNFLSVQQHRMFYMPKGGSLMQGVVFVGERYLSNVVTDHVPW